MQNNPLPAVMGIINVTPDSFAVRHNSTDEAVATALAYLDAGCDIIDIGGESTRPGAPEVAIETEIARVLPVIIKIKELCPESVLSIDTRKSAVAREALNAGCRIVNDVSALEFSPDMAQVAAEYNAVLVLNHSRGTPETMQNKEFLNYSDVVTDVRDFLLEAAKKALKAGVKKENIILDPGIGFGKNVEQNLRLLANLDKFKETGYQLLVGVSRKSFIGAVLNEKDPAARMIPSVALAVYMTVRHNVDIIRVHDVTETLDALKIVQSCRNFEQ